MSRTAFTALLALVLVAGCTAGTGGRVVVKGAEAFIDYEYRYAYQFKVGEEESWDAGVEVNRLELKRVNDQWKIVSGL